MCIVQHGDGQHVHVQHSDDGQLGDAHNQEDGDADHDSLLMNWFYPSENYFTLSKLMI